jgi:hypothetical protein
MSEFADEIKKIKVTFTDGTSEDFESFKDLEEYLKDDEPIEETSEKETDENITDNEVIDEDSFKSYKAKRKAQLAAKKKPLLDVVESLAGKV